MNLPNKLTMLRMILIPVFLIFMFLEIQHGVGPGIIVAFNDYIALFIFFVASITDFFDGYIARKRNMVTDFGKLFDPVADKLLVCSALIGLVYRYCTWDRFLNDESFFSISGAPFVMALAIGVIIIIARELFITAFRSMAAKNNIIIAADMPGKIKTFTQMIGISFLIAALDLVIMDVVIFYIAFFIGFVALMVGVIMAIISCILYLVKYKVVFSDMGQKKEEKGE